MSCLFMYASKYNFSQTTIIKSKPVVSNFLNIVQNKMLLKLFWDKI